MESPEGYEGGNSLDAMILSGLLIAAILVLVGRRQRCLELLRANWPTVLFFGYCLISVLWSDFPLVGFKRWTKALGNLSMVLVVLTDPSPLAAMKRFLNRISFILIPVSALFIKYYPALGRGYNRWTWEPYYTGVTTDKNSLGAICLVFGLASVWRVVEAVRENPPSRNRMLIAHGALLLVNLWVLWVAESSTSTGCFLLGSAIIVAVTIRGRKHPSTIHIIAGIIGCVALLAYLFPDVYAYLTQTMGRKPDLTGRTDIWNDLFHMHLNPWVGTGFETFWLGKRAEFFWRKYYFHPNQAHNGYIEIYINLGWIGVCFLVAQMVAGYRNVVSGFRRNAPGAALRIGYLAAAAIYNLTEAAFKVMHPVWIAFLIAVIALPEPLKTKAFRRYVECTELATDPVEA